MNIKVELRLIEDVEMEVRILSDDLGNGCEIAFPLNTDENQWARAIGSIALGPQPENNE